MGKDPYPDLKFDQKAASAAVTQLQDVIKLLSTQTTNRVKKANAIGPPNWTGTYSDQFFKNELPRMKSQAASLVTELQGLITTINTASQNAEWYQAQNDQANGTHIVAPGPLGQPPPSAGPTI